MSFDWRPANKPPQNRSEAEQRRDAKALADKKRKDVDYEPGKDEAYLSSKDVKTQRPSQKFE